MVGERGIDVEDSGKLAGGAGLLGRRSAISRPDSLPLQLYVRTVVYHDPCTRVGVMCMCNCAYCMR